MGRITVEITVENLSDLWQARRVSQVQDTVRQVTTEASVNTGATLLALPSQLIRQLGLEVSRTVQVATLGGPREAPLYDSVRLTVLGRQCTLEVLEVPATVPALLGQVPLALLDFLVDPVERKLIGNPSHGGEQIVELY